MNVWRERTTHPSMASAMFSTLRRSPPEEQALDEPAGVALGLGPPEQRGVPVEERLQLRLQPPQLLDVHRTLRPETVPTEVVAQTQPA